MVRIQGWGGRAPYHLGLPIFKRPRGDLLVRLRVYPDKVTPRYRPVAALDTEELALEGWVYRQSGALLGALKGRPLELPPMTASEIADLYNAGGWREISRALVARLGLEYHKIDISTSENLPVPGQCARQVKTTTGLLSYKSVAGYLIKIRSEFVTDPFAVTAILAHELCHVVENLYLAADKTGPSPAGKALTELERKVDLLVFLHQLGEFQLRVARESRLTLGYFNQEMFERMYMIFERKRKAQ